jgi:hypothetical protein
MDTIGLTKERHGTDYVPPLVAIRCNRWMDQVTVRMLPGQWLQDWVDVADRLAQTFGALDCRVRTTPNSQRVQLWFLVRDPLAQVVPPLQPTSILAGCWSTAFRSRSPRTAPSGGSRSSVAMCCWSAGPAPASPP